MPWEQVACLAREHLDLACRVSLITVDRRVRRAVERRRERAWMTVREECADAVAAMIISRAVRPKACLAAASNPTIGADTCGVARGRYSTQRAAYISEADSGIHL